jgi:DNA-binding MarR family transcriptional regulator
MFSQPIGLICSSKDKSTSAATGSHSKITLDKNRKGVYTPIMNVEMKPDYLNTISPEVCVANNLQKVARAIIQAYEKALKPSGITISQFSTLGTLNMVGPLPLSKMAEVMDLDRTTLARNLKLLTRNNLVSIENDLDDQRAKVISITEKGLQTLEKAAPMWVEAQQHFVKGLGVSQTEDLMDTLAEIRHLAMPD